MTSSSITFSVFTKPWKTPLAELGRMVSALGFDGIERWAQGRPLRYEVSPRCLRSWRDVQF